MRHRGLTLILLLLALAFGRAQRLTLAGPENDSSSAIALSGVAGFPAAPGAASFAPAPVHRPQVRDNRLVTIDWGLIAAAGLLRYLDYRSTEQCASDPRDFREKELPESLVRNKAALAAFESGAVVVNYFAYRWVARRHRRLARVGQVINLGAVGFAVGGNYAALLEHYPRQHLPLTMPNRP